MLDHMHHNGGWLWWGALYLLLVTPASAELTPCSSDDVDALKVHADDMHTTSTAESLPEAADLKSRLRFLLEGRIDELKDSGVDLDVVVVPCPGRIPTSQIDFGPDFIKGMNQNNIVMEIWGTLDAVRPAAGEALRPQATLSYLLVPYEITADAPEGFFKQSYDLGASGEALLAQFELAGEMDALVALSLALKLTRQGDSDRAFGAWCAADVLMTLRPPALGTGVIDTLRAFATEKGQEALDDSRAAVASGDDAGDGGSALGAIPGTFRELCDQQWGL